MYEDHTMIEQGLLVVTSSAISDLEKKRTLGPEPLPLSQVGGIPAHQTSAKVTMNAPPGYYVVESPNEAEAGSFSCPYQGCGGRGFSSAEESESHHIRWHSGPYECAECGSNFAAMPTLERHMRSSQHRNRWICGEMECELGGAEFPTRAAFMKHVISSSSCHGRFPAKEVIEDTIFVEIEERQSDPEPSLTPKKEAILADYVCHEECCRKFGIDFKCKSEYARHVVSAMHRYGTAIGQRLRCQVIPPDLLQAETSAIRSLQCNAQSCSSHGVIFSTVKRYVQHLGTMEHRCGHVLDLGKIDTPKSGGQGSGQEEFHCCQRGCHGEGHVFSDEDGLNSHLALQAHRQAEGEPDTPKTPKNFKKHLMSPLDLSALPTPVSPSSPSFGRGDRSLPKTKKSNGSRGSGLRRATPEASRLNALEHENAELKERIQRLESSVERMSIVLGERANTVPG